MENFKHNPDIHAVFNHAEKYLPKVKDEMMYMYSDDTFDYFKDIITRAYKKVPTLGGAE